MSVSSKTVDNSRLRWIDTLRGIAALGVVVQHYFWFPLGFGKSLSNYFDMGSFGVVAFFCISGFIIPASIRTISPAPLTDFVRARLFRLFPSYWFSLALGVIVYNAAPPQVIANIFMIQRFIGSSDVVGPYWTLQIELIFYVFVAMAIYGKFIGSVRFASNAAILFSVLSVAMGAIRFYAHIKAPLAAFSGLTVIFFGYCFYMYSRNIMTPKIMFLVSAVCSVMLFAAFRLGYDRNWGFNENYMRSTISYAVGIGTFLLFFRFSISIPLISWVGLISYPLYLMHEPVFDLVKGSLPQMGKLEVGALSLLVSVFVSALLHYYVERPAIALGRQMMGARGG